MPVCGYQLADKTLHRNNPLGRQATSHAPIAPPSTYQVPRATSSVMRVTSLVVRVVWQVVRRSISFAGARLAGGSQL